MKVPGVIDGLAAEVAASDGDAEIAPETAGIPVFGTAVPDAVQPATTATTATPHKNIRAFIVPLRFSNPTAYTRTTSR
jgi:hypothetical protein